MRCLTTLWDNKENYFQFYNVFYNKFIILETFKENSSHDKKSR